MSRGTNTLTAWAVAALTVAIAGVTSASETSAPDDAMPGSSPWARIFTTDLFDGLEHTVRVLNYGVITDTVTSGLNEGNVLNLSRYRLESDVRADLALRFDRLALTAKPRWDLKWEQWEDGDLSGTDDADEELYINEWMIRYRLPGDVFASYTRENLQWGPAFLLSPSNPFGGENGRSNPKQEVRGADFVKLMWVPNFNWTFTLIANVDDGRRLTPWNADEAYSLAIAGARQRRAEGQEEIDRQVAAARRQAAQERDRVLTEIDRQCQAARDQVNSGGLPSGGVGGGTIRDLLRLRKRGETPKETANRLIDEQCEAGYEQVRKGYGQAQRTIDAKKADAERDADSQVGAAIDDFDEATRELREFHRTYAAKIDCVLDKWYWGVVMSKRESGEFRGGYYGKWDATDALVLYTEGSHGEGGDIEALVGGSYTLAVGPTLCAEYFYNESGDAELPIGEIIPPFRAIDPRDIFLRKNYLLLQAMENDIFGRMDLTLRWVYGLDDGSNRFITQALYDANDSMELFFISVLDSGGDEDEFGSAINYTAMAGCELAF